MSIRTPGMHRTRRLIALAAALLACAAHAAPPEPSPNATDPAATNAADADGLRLDTLHLPAPGVADAPLRVRVLLPPGYRADAAIGHAVLYLNDGQDLEAVQVRETVAALATAGRIRAPIVVAADMPPDRMGAYGLSDRTARHGLVAQTRYGPVGMRAHAYSEWVAKTLVPAIDARYRTRTTPDARAVLGWSLGALNAFNLGWQYPALFGRVGAFSPSLWLAADRGDAGSIERTRIAQQLVHTSAPRGGLKLFFAVGDAEETDDRDRDGVIDVLDDARDLITGYGTAADPRAKGFAQLGYSTNLDHATTPTRADVALHVFAGGRHEQASWARMLPAFLEWAYAVRAPAIDATGTVEGWQALPSAHVPARDVDVWLPPSYGTEPARRYPVVYMHDGQNLFDPALSYTGIDWDVDGAMTRLVETGAVREAIVVGVWNTPRRFLEYMPRGPVAGPTLPSGVADVPPLPADAIASDAYLRFLVDELKPLIDSTYRTRPGREDTFVMGSSMGGLVSLYAVAAYPQVFGGVGAVSTHWPVGDGIAVDWFARHLPRAGAHRLYFDFGTATLDAAYAPYQARMDAALPALGYTAGRDWLTRRFEGAEHNEAAWKARVEVPLVFLLGSPLPER